MLIDTHCHLYVREFAADIDNVIQNAVDAGVSQFYLPAIDSGSTAAILLLEQKYPNACFAMAGLHPCSVKQNYREELDKISTSLQQKKFAAIGETGLDFYWDKTFMKEQYLALEAQIALALKYTLPIVLHTRNAMQETIDVIKNHKNSGLTGIFHCFGGTVEEAEQIIDLGFFLGIGGVITYKNAGVAEVIKKISLDYMVLETDAPYLAPVPYRGKRNESAHLKIIAGKLAEIINVPVQKIAEATTRNAASVFRKPYLQNA